MNGPATLLTITFDMALQPDAGLDTGNWAVRFDNITRTVTGGLASGSTVVLSLTAGGADVDIDRVSFAPPPDDVITLLGGLPVLAFTDFPVTS